MKMTLFAGGLSWRNPGFLCLSVLRLLQRIPVQFQYFSTSVSAESLGCNSPQHTAVHSFRYPIRRGVPTFPCTPRHAHDLTTPRHAARCPEMTTITTLGQFGTRTSYDTPGPKDDIRSTRGVVSLGRGNDVFCRVLFTSDTFGTL